MAQSKDKIDDKPDILLEETIQENQNNSSDTDGDKNYWEKRFKSASNEIDELNKQLATAFRSMDSLIKKLAELENSKLVKFRKYFYLYLARLRSNFNKGKKRNFGSILI